METQKNVHVVRYMTDEEYDHMVQEKKREELLKRLQEASAKKPKAVTKAIPQKEPEKEKKEPEFTEDGKIIVHSLKDLGDMDDDGWDLVMSHLDGELMIPDSSPIEDVTLSNIVDLRFSRDSDDEVDRYNTLFKEEIAMASEILKGLKEHSKYVGAKLKSMSGSGKGVSGGITKSYADLVSSFNSLETSMLTGVKTIADLKLKREELRLKYQKENPDNTRSVDDLVDQYYNRVLSGDQNQQYLQATKSMYLGDDYGEEQRPISLTQQLRDDSYQEEYPEPEYDEEADPGGYIRNENRNVEIVVYRYKDSHMEFAALDQDGEIIDDYEVPNQDTLESVRVSPGSRYGYDKYGRKYQVLDVGEGVPLDDDLID